MIHSSDHYAQIKKLHDLLTVKRKLLYSSLKLDMEPENYQYMLAEIKDLEEQLEQLMKLYQN